MLVQMAESYRYPRNIDDSSASLSSQTPSPIPARMPPNPMEPIVRQSLNSDVTIEAPQSSSKRFKKPKKTLATSPSSEPNRFTGARLKGRAPISYDMKYHPMDEVLRPNAHATLSARSQRLVSSTRESSLRGLDNLKERGADPVSNSDMKRERNHTLKDQVARKSPRFARSSTQNEKRVNYNMGYHLIDDVLRLKTRKRHSVWLKNVSIPTTSSSSSSTALPRIKFDNPFAKPISPDWGDLEVFDRRVYTLQKGAPFQGTTLPLEWTRIVRILVTQGFFTEAEFKAVGGLNALVSRYETIRLEIQGFFKSAPEPVDKRNWPIRYVEDLKVFEYESGTKYWRHHRHSIVNPRSNKIDDRAQAVTANSETSEDGNAPDFVSNQQVTLPISDISTSEEASFEFVLRRQLEDFNGNIDKFPDDQDNSFKEAFDLLQPSIDADCTLDAILSDPFVETYATPGIPKEPERHTAEAALNVKDDHSVHTTSDRKLLVRKATRDSKTKPSTANFQILEDEPGGTPLIRKYISMNPASPGTDIQKENFEDRRSPSEGDLSDNYRMIRSGSRQHLVAVPPSPQFDRFRAVRAIQPRELFRSPSNSEAMTTESTDNLSYQPWMQAPTVTPFTPIRRSVPFTSVVHEE